MEGVVATGFTSDGKKITCDELVRNDSCGYTTRNSFHTNEGIGYTYSPPSHKSKGKSGQRSCKRPNSQRGLLLCKSRTTDMSLVNACIRTGLPS